MNGLIRSFIAIPLPADVHHSLENFSRKMGLVDRSNGLRPVKPENIHITLKFLGDITQQQVKDLSACLDQSVDALVPFNVEIRGVGAFPGRQKSPRVIWVGASPSAPLQQVYKTIDSATQRIGFPSENRPFSPHLTLARVSLPGGSASQRVIESLMKLTSEPFFGQFQVNKVVLFKSLLQPGGPIYSTLSSHHFKK